MRNNRFYQGSLEREILEPNLKMDQEIPASILTITKQYILVLP